MADRTATLVLNNAATFGASTALMTDRLVVGIISVVYQMVLDRFCNRIGAGKHAVVAEAGRAMAGYPLKLFHHLTSLNAAAPG